MKVAERSRVQVAALLLLAACSTSQGGITRPQGTAVRAEDVATGTMDRAAYEKALHQHVREIVDCYETALLRDASTGGGEVVFEWVIALDGSVSQLNARSSTLRSSDAVTCMLGVLNRISFPRPHGGAVSARQRFQFKSVGY